MSKKRKTRKQKEEAQKRHILSSHIHEIEKPVYTISESVKPAKKEVARTTNEDLESNKFFKKDMTAIIGASGIILAFDILLYILLSTGTVRLGFLGY